MSSLGCVYCDPTNTNYRPTKCYILDGCSVCEVCLRKIQTNYEETGEGYRPLGHGVDINSMLNEEDSDEKVVDVISRHLTGLTMKLFNEGGVCLMSSRIDSPVVNGDTIQFPPIKVSL